MQTTINNSKFIFAVQGLDPGLYLFASDLFVLAHALDGLAIGDTEHRNFDDGLGARPPRPETSTRERILNYRLVMLLFLRLLSGLESCLVLRLQALQLSPKDLQAMRSSCTCRLSWIGLADNGFACVRQPLAFYSSFVSGA